MKICIIILVVTAAVAYGDKVEPKEPKELTALKSVYTQEVARVLAPVDARYIEALTQLKKKLGGAGDIDGAVAVDAELKSVVIPAADNNIPKTMAKWNNVTVKSTEIQGTKLGTFKKGQTLIFKYVSGEWTVNTSRHKLQNPDISETGFRPIICKDGNRETTVAMLSVNTKQTPYEYAVEEDAILFLRVNDPGSLADNKGAVTYAVLIK